ncbi:MAG TPA: spore photoproduct lyase, partial [Bacillota bacterium]|nr:spore photoproduct lyase [Bacillota bacterium]
MKLFEPKRVFFEEAALNYPLGEKILEYLAAADIPVRMITSSSRISGIPGSTPQESYWEGKNTLVVGVKRDLKLSTCKPSADFEFGLATGCPGGCQYCYLQTHLGKKPYIRI